MSSNEENNKKANYCNVSFRRTVKEIKCFCSTGACGKVIHVLSWASIYDAISQDAAHQHHSPTACVRRLRTGNPVDCLFNSDHDK